MSQFGRVWQYVAGGVTFNGLAARRLPHHFPNSAFAARYWKMTFDGANKFPEQLERLISVVEGDRVDSSDPQLVPGDEPMQRLAGLLDKYGSDKDVNGYTATYAGLLETLIGKGSGVRLLEIGLGSNTPGAISGMGKEGRPGASLRAFRDFDEGIVCYGADVDRLALFNEERIKTAWVDQLEPESLSALDGILGESTWDLIIDDGLHSPAANLNVLIFGLERISQDGFIVIEDIPVRALPVWTLVRRLLAIKAWTVHLIDTEHSTLAVIFREAS